MPSVRLKDNENFEYALRRFRRAVDKAGIVTEARAREFYEKPAQVRKRQMAAAVKRTKKDISRERFYQRKNRGMLSR